MDYYISHEKCHQTTEKPALGLRGGITCAAKSLWTCWMVIMKPNRIIVCIYIYYNPGKPYSNPIQPIHHEFDEHETIVIVVVYEFQHEFGTPFTVP